MLSNTSAVLTTDFLDKICSTALMEENGVAVKLQFVPVSVLSYLCQKLLTLIISDLKFVCRGCTLKNASQFLLIFEQYYLHIEF